MPQAQTILNVTSVISFTIGLFLLVQFKQEVFNLVVKSNLGKTYSDYAGTALTLDISSKLSIGLFSLLVFMIRQAIFDRISLSVKKKKKESLFDTRLQLLQYVYLGGFILIAAYSRKEQVQNMLLPAKFTGGRKAKEMMTVSKSALVGLSLLWTVIMAVLVLFTFGKKLLVFKIRKSWRSTRKEMVTSIKNNYTMRHHTLFQYSMLLTLISIFAIGWKLVLLTTNSDSPVVVVLSGSMEPAFYRGDLLVLTNRYEDPIVPGEIVVFKIEGRDIPIVHRVMQVHRGNDANEASDYSDVKYLTKGDNNNINDRGLYAENQLWLSRKDIVGRARFFIPQVGQVTIILNDNPIAKWILVGVMVFMMIYYKEFFFFYKYYIYKNACAPILYSTRSCYLVLFRHPYGFNYGS